MFGPENRAKFAHMRIGILSDTHGHLDDRILHRGLANASQQERWVAYFSYLRPRPGLEDIADTHFEATRSLFG